MKRILFACCGLLFFTLRSAAQSSPNLANATTLAPGAEKASKLSAVPVNIFTGVPQVGVPLYSYNNPNNNLSLNISLDYFAGGTQVAEAPTTVGLGWFLNAGGSITRTVRGAPDDMPTSGYMYASAIPSDYRSTADKYYFDSLDAQQDVFQYNFNGRSGKFFIGKNGQIVVVPLSKLKIIPNTGAGSPAQILSFRIIAEDGVKYDFSNGESTTTTTDGADSALFRSAYSGQSYYSAWQLSRIISPFNTDTIKLNYTNNTVTYGFGYPQVTFVRNSDGVQTKTFSPTGTSSLSSSQISSIAFPDKTSVTFLYSGGSLLTIKIGDTAFRFGYLLNYTRSFGYNPIRALLTSVTPFTPKEKKQGYSFSYNAPWFAPLGSYDDTIQNKRDHWGYYNGANNGTTLIPQINGYSWGANRGPNISYAAANTLSLFNLPGGGHIYYEYELNAHYPYTKSLQRLTVYPTTTSATTVAFNQVFNNLQQVRIVLDSTISRQGSAPLSGSGNWTLNIKSTDGSVTYASTTVSLYDLFYQGIRTWSFNLADGNYQIEAVAASSTTITGSFPVNILWENRQRDASKTEEIAGGLRVWRVTRRNTIDDPSGVVQQYRYVNADGTSSGFLGDIPRYDYAYQETVNNGGSTTTAYTAVSSEPVSTMNYAQGSPVGYSRVEVIEGTTNHSNGKTVYDFTSLNDLNTTTTTATFPYAAQDIRNWGLGAPKTISVYDSTGRLVKKSINTYGIDSVSYVSSNFKSLKLGNSYTVCNGNPSVPSTPKVRTYLAQDWYPTSGRIYLSSTLDSLFQTNGSVNTSLISYSYDTAYNVKSIATTYDRNRGLQLEKRLYYPYNYTLGGSVGKLRDSGILTTVIATESWVTGDANPRMIAGAITDYQQLSAGYIKPATVYALRSNKPVPEATIGGFDPSVLNRNSSYFIAQTSFPVYDGKANPLQVQNLVSGHSNSMIMDYGGMYAVAKVANAAAADIAYTSFESDGSGNWTIGSALRDTLNALSGKKSYNLSNGNVSRSGLSSGKNYFVSLWAKSGATVYVNGTQQTSVVATQLNWNLYQTTLSGITSITVSGSGSIDELRLHPAEAAMATTTYEPFVGPTTSVDANNTVVYTEYDNLNRIKLIRDKDRNILKRYDYSDSSMVININPVWDSAKTCTGSSGGYYYLYTDNNQLSDTYLNTRTGGSGTDCISCPFTCTGASRKLINCVCEEGQRCNTSCTHVKIILPDNTVIWKWRCTYHYEWSDSSVSADYSEDGDYACSLGCGDYNP